MTDNSIFTQCPPHVVPPPGGHLGNIKNMWSVVFHSAKNYCFFLNCQEELPDSSGGNSSTFPCIGFKR